MTKREWSIYQKKIFVEANKGDGHLIVEALAGSGKTTTLIESTRYIPKGKKVIALAFNKIIQQDLSERVSARVEALTFHSLGLRAIKQRFKNVEIDDNKVFKLVQNSGDVDKDEFDLIINVCDAVAFCKYSLVDTPAEIEKIIYRFGIDTCEVALEQFIRLVIKTLAADKAQTDKIDFNDMCWMHFVYNLPLGTYDVVYVDEFQDLNRSQMLMAKKVCNPKGGRILVFGDSKQDLYSWRGSDTSIVKELKNEPTTKTLTLPITYRCPKTVVELVKPWVPALSCPDAAKDGTIENISAADMYKLAKPGCFVLSRTNAPLIKICFAFIRNGKKCNIRGRDIGKGLASLIKKSKKKTIPAFLKWLEKWKNNEVEKLQSKGIKPDSILDRYECLVNLCDEVGSLEEVGEKINELFNDNDEKNIIVLSSIHRAKGLERDEVFLLKWTCRGWFDVVFDSEEENEEMNIAYVGATRAKDKLYLISKY